MGRNEERDSPQLIVAGGSHQLRLGAVEAVQRGIPGVTAGTVSDAAEAWRAFADRGTRILLLAADMDGWDRLVERVRSHPEGGGCCIVRVGGRPGDLAAADVDDAILDPVNPDELAWRVAAAARRRRDMARLGDAVRQLEAVNDRHTEFLSVVSHEIRTPLSALLSAANILIRYGREQPESVERFATVIREEGRRLTRLINDLLDLEKIESGLVAWEFAPHTPAELLEQARASFAALAGESEVRLEVVEDGDPPPLVVDRDKILQVVLNLLSNAVKHSPPGGTVRLRCGSDEGWLRLEVEDEGDGIPSGCEERIFERFHQLPGDDERRGSGLGLTISRQIVQRHGGHIEVVPERRKGAHFVVRLPLTGDQGRHGPVR